MLSALHFNSYTFCTAFRFLCILIHCILILTISLLYLSLHLKHACNLLRHCNSVCWQNYEKDNLTFDPLPWLNNFPFDIISCECYDNTKNMLYTVENAYVSSIPFPMLSALHSNSYTFCPASQFLCYLPCILIHILSALPFDSYGEHRYLFYWKRQRYVCFLNKIVWHHMIQKWTIATNGFFFN
jgi:hypothetical protein